MQWHTLRATERPMLCRQGLVNNQFFGNGGVGGFLFDGGSSASRQYRAFIVTNNEQLMGYLTLIEMSLL